MEKTEKISTSFRLPTDTVEKIDKLTTLLGMSKTDVLARAVDRLFNEREAVAKEDYERRVSQSKQ